MHQQPPRLRDFLPIPSPNKTLKRKIPMRIKRVSKKLPARFFLIFIFFLGSQLLLGQETARQFFTKVVEKYDTLPNFQANLTIQTRNSTLRGVLAFTQPNLLQIRFSNPSGQVINIAAGKIQVYVPGYSTTFTQDLNSDDSNALIPGRDSMTTLLSDYEVSYPASPNWTTAEGISGRVKILHFSRRTANAGFKTIVHTIGESLLIYRIKAVSIYNDTYTITFSNIDTTSSVPKRTILEYSAPPSGNSTNGFYPQS